MEDYSSVPEKNHVPVVVDKSLRGLIQDWIDSLDTGILRAARGGAPVCPFDLDECLLRQLGDLSVDCQDHPVGYDDNQSLQDGETEEWVIDPAWLEPHPQQQEGVNLEDTTPLTPLEVEFEDTTGVGSDAGKGTSLWAKALSWRMEVKWKSYRDRQSALASSSKSKSPSTDDDSSDRGGSRSIHCSTLSSRYSNESEALTAYSDVSDPRRVGDISTGEVGLDGVWAGRGEAEDDHEGSDTPSARSARDVHGASGGESNLGSEDAGSTAWDKLDSTSVADDVSPAWRNIPKTSCSDTTPMSSSRGAHFDYRAWQTLMRAQRDGILRDVKAERELRSKFNRRSF